jgi:hypothetical protein
VDLIKKHDINILTETWLSQKTHYNLNIQGYNAHHLYGNKSVTTRKGRYSGGITIYYKSELCDKINFIEEHQCGIMWFKLCKSIFNSNTDVCICCTYIPPFGSKVINRNQEDFF